MKNQKVVFVAVLAIVIVLLALPQLFGQYQDGPEPTKFIAQPLFVEVSASLDCAITVDPNELVGKSVTIVGVQDDYLCIESDTGTFKLKKWGEDNMLLWENFSFSVDSHGLTGRSEWRPSVGQSGKVETYRANNIDKYRIVGVPFKDVYGTPEDKLFTPAWESFRHQGIRHFSDIVSYPRWLNNSEFTENFTPQDACWDAKDYSFSVKIDPHFSYCQYEDDYNGRNFLTIGSYIYYSPESAPIEHHLIAILPNNEDKPETLKPGTTSVKGIKFVGCYPLEGYSEDLDYETVTPFFALEGQSFLGQPFSDAKYYVDPIGVVFEVDGERVGEVVPYRALIRHTSFDGESSSQELFKLPLSCHPYWLSIVK